MKEKTRIIVAGTGAVGSYYGGRLALGGAEVSVICRSDYDAVKNNGIEVSSVEGDFLFKPHYVMKNISDYPHVPDYIMVSTKVLPGVNVPEIIGAGVRPQTSIFLLQNGIDVEVPVASKFPANEIISGLAFICVSRTSHGKIEHQDYGRVAIGRYPGGVSSSVERLHSLFREAGVNCEISSDIIQSRWKKMIWNAPFNPLSVLCGGADTSEMINSPQTLRVVKKIMEEVVLLSRVTGHPLDDSIIEQNIRDTVKMTPYKTSMLLDYENKREMEVEAILGNALRIAEKHGLNLPSMETVYGALSLLNKKNMAS